MVRIHQKFKYGWLGSSANVNLIKLGTTQSGTTHKGNQKNCDNYETITLLNCTCTLKYSQTKSIKNKAKRRENTSGLPRWFDQKNCH